MDKKRVGRQLRWLADGYEQAQAKRVATGEQIRAVLQDRDETWDVDDVWAEVRRNILDPENALTANDVLDDITRGMSLGPVPILGRTYQRFATEESELQRDMLAALHQHPTWPWLEKVKGIGGTLGCKLIARLDIREADTPSAFSAYCGLATIPGEKWRCPDCGKERTWPVGFNVTGKHTVLDGGGQCPTLMVKVAGPEDGIRAAMPRGFTVLSTNKKGETKPRRPYDAYAKKLMYQIMTSFIMGKKYPGKYYLFYEAARAKLDIERPGWAPAGKHHTAMRKTEKLFLSHLWLVWRKAEGLPITEPYAHVVLGHQSKPIDPWDMVG